MSKLIFVKREAKPFGMHLIEHPESWEIMVWLIRTRITIAHYKREGYHSDLLGLLGGTMRSQNANPMKHLDNNATNPYRIFVGNQVRIYFEKLTDMDIQQIIEACEQELELRSQDNDLRDKIKKML
jgi:hypothetical protein